MNKPLSITDALHGKQSPIAKYPFRFECGCCGREDFGNGPPLVVACIECGERIEAESNPEFIGTMTCTASPTVPTGDHGTEFVSHMLLTTIRGE